jgi:hypothetical protein
MFIASQPLLRMTVVELELLRPPCDMAQQLMHRACPLGLSTW